MSKSFLYVSRLPANVEEPLQRAFGDHSVREPAGAFKPVVFKYSTFTKFKRAYGT